MKTRPAQINSIIPAPQFTVKADFIFLLPTCYLKKKNRIDFVMRKINKKICSKYGINVLWGYGDRKDYKGKETWYVCFNMEESIKNHIVFYANRIHLEIVELWETERTKLDLFKTFKNNKFPTK